MTLLCLNRILVVFQLLFRLGITVMPANTVDDSRQCLFCHQFGDSVSDGPARYEKYAKKINDYNLCFH